MMQRPGKRGNVGAAKGLVRGAVIGGAIASLLSLTGCIAEGRSVHAYCETYHEGISRIKSSDPSRVDATGQDALAAALSATSDLGDAVALVGDLADVAPEAIRTDVQRVHDALQKEIDSAGSLLSNPLGAALDDMMTIATTSGAVERVERFTARNCDHNA